MKELKTVAKWLLIAIAAIFILYSVWPRGCMLVHAASPTVSHAAGTAWDTYQDMREPDPAQPSEYLYLPARITFVTHPRAIWGARGIFLGVPIGGFTRERPVIQGRTYGAGNRIGGIVSAELGNPSDCTSRPTSDGPSYTCHWTLTETEDGRPSGIMFSAESLTINVDLDEVVYDGSIGGEIARAHFPVSASGVSPGQLAVRGGWVGIEQLGPVVHDDED
ncbi:MAG TPA: hypothetical protein VMU11_01195 [Verrucomicrobiae bacterium]|nr:hypothetical protein [Verrucomicrobiae bacterium]